MLVFGILAKRVAELIRARPSLAQRLALAPPEAIHSIAAYLHLVANPATTSAAEIATLMEDSHPRTLLSAALPTAPARLYRALSTAGSRARGRAFYQRLGAVVSGPFASAFLEGDLSDRRVIFYELLDTLDPVVAALHSSLADSCEIALAVNDLVTFLRAHSTFDDAAFRFPEGAGIASVLRRLQIALDAVRAPLLGFIPPPSFRTIESIGELRKVGRDFRNCLQQRHHYATGRWFALADGSTRYLVDDKRQLLIALRHVGPELYVVDDLEHPANDDVPSALRATVIDEFRAAGVRLLSLTPVCAMSKLR